MRFLFKIILTLLLTLNSGHSKEIEVSIGEMVNLLSGGAILIDIRREEEWKETGIIDGSITSTLFHKDGTANLIKFLSDVRKSANAEQSIILICRTGRRTKIATQYMLDNTEFKSVFSVNGGITKWKKKGFKTIAYQ